MFQRLSSALFLLLLLLPQLLFAGHVTERMQATKTLIVGTPGDFPPFSATTIHGQLIGLDIDLAKTLAAGLGVKLTLQRMEFAKLLPAVKDGSIDMALSGITMLPDRNMDVAFIGPYALSGQALLGKDKYIATITSNEELAAVSFRLAALKGTTSEKAAREGMRNVQLTLTDTHDQSLILLLNGKVDAILADFPFCKIAEFRYPDHGFTVLDEPLTFEPLGIAISGTDPLFMNIIQNYLLLLEGSGALEKMKERWFKHNDWIKELPDMTFFKDLEQ